MVDEVTARLSASPLFDGYPRAPLRGGRGDSHRFAMLVYGL